MASCRRGAPLALHDVRENKQKAARTTNPKNSRRAGTTLHPTDHRQARTKSQTQTHGGNKDRDGALFCVDDDGVVVLQEGDRAAVLRLRGDVSDDKSGRIQARNARRDQRTQRSGSDHLVDTYGATSGTKHRKTKLGGLSKVADAKFQRMNASLTRYSGACTDTEVRPG